MKRFAILCVLLFASITHAQSTPIRFPSIKDIPVTPSAPPTIRLTAEVWYVIEADIPVVVLASPERLVKIVEAAGPIKARGKFADGTGKTEIRTYSGKQVFFIESAHESGTVELIVVPLGFKGEKDILRKTITVDGPAPPVPVPPDPTPKKADKLTVIAIWESADSTPAIAKVFQDLTFFKSLETMGHKWHKIDKDQKAPDGSLALDFYGYREYVDKAGLPTILYMDQTTNKVLHAERLPANVAAISAKIKELTGR